MPLSDLIRPRSLPCSSAYLVLYLCSLYSFLYSCVQHSLVSGLFYSWILRKFDAGSGRRHVLTPLINETIFVRCPDIMVSLRNTELLIWLLSDRCRNHLRFGLPCHREAQTGPGSQLNPRSPSLYVSVIDQGCIEIFLCNLVSYHHPVSSKWWSSVLSLILST